MNIKIYTMTHKAFDIPPDPMYVPLQVGSAVNGDLGYLRDDTGENISAQNVYYSELTGFYWIWKNDRDSDYIGTCHYRRFLLNRQEKIFTGQELNELLKEYDLITTKRVLLNNSYHYGFAANHNILALDMVGEVIRERYPAYHEVFLEAVHGPETYFGNILITDRKLFGEYCEFLFSVFGETASRIDLDTDEDAYHKRVFGFISEFLLLVWTRVKGLKVYECKVGMLGEKAETREMKEKIAEYLRVRDVKGAKQYFLEQHRKRPDVLMEASDITGELRLAMQIIETADLEYERGGTSILEKETDFGRLTELFAGINRAVLGASRGALGAKEKELLKQPYVSETALLLAAAILPGIEDRQGLSAYLSALKE